MTCCNYVPGLRATGIAVAAGVTTVTVGATPEIIDGGVYDIVLSTAIPDGTDGTQLSITNGTVTGNVMNGNGNYFRPLPLRSRTVLRVQFLADPAHFQILSVFGRRR